MNCLEKVAKAFDGLREETKTNLMHGDYIVILGNGKTNGKCGPDYLFYKLFHNNGSFRFEALQISID